MRSVDRPERRVALERGLTASVAVGGVLLIWLYGVAAPSPDLRARIPFLLNTGGGMAILMLFSLFALLGLAALAVVGDLTRWSVAGVGIGALACVLLLSSGAVGAALPTSAETRPRYGVLALSVTAAIGTLWWMWRARSAFHAAGRLTR
jgi:hypothetical protein